MVQTLSLNGGSNQQRLDGKWRRRSSEEYVSSTFPRAIECTAKCSSYGYGEEGAARTSDRQVSCILLALLPPPPPCVKQWHVLGTSQIVPKADKCRGKARSTNHVMQCRLYPAYGPAGHCWAHSQRIRTPDVPWRNITIEPAMRG